MNIRTTNEKGERVIINYSEKVIAPETPKQEIIINDYQTFRKCVIESNNQQEYRKDQRDNRYEEALAELIRRDRNLYMSYTDKLHKEYSGK